MSLKSTLAHGDGWHFYETFDEPGLMFLRLDNVTLTVTKDMAKGILIALEKLEARDWVLFSEDDGNTSTAIENQIEWLKGQLHKKKISDSNTRVILSAFQLGEDWLPEDHREGCNDGPHCTTCGWCEFDGSCVCYAR